MHLVSQVKSVLKSVFLLSLLLSTIALADIQVIKVAIVANKSTQNMEQLSIQLWDKVASQLHYAYVMGPVADEKTAFDLLRQHKVDIVLGLPAHYEAVPGVNFLNSYLDDVISVVTSDRRLSTWEIIMPYLKIGLSAAFFLIMLLTFGVGIMVWLVEREKNTDEFSKDFWNGVGSGFWFSLSTMTTIGYGDKVPKTLLGRIVTGIWMFIIFIAASSVTVVLTAELSSAKMLQRDRIRVDDLRGKLVAYGRYNAQTKQLASRFTDRPVEVKSVKQALDYLEADKIAAAFITSLSLHCYFKDHMEAPTVRTDYEFNLGSYAFAVAEHSAFTLDINQALYFMQQRGEMRLLENSCGS